MSHLLGTGVNVSYEDWQTAMMAKEEEFEQNGTMSGQQLANLVLMSHSSNYKDAIVSERGVRTIARNGKYLFHAVLEPNSYVLKTESLGTNSRVYTSEEVALLAN